MTKDSLREIVKSLKLKPTEEVLNGIEVDFKKIKADFKELKKIDITNVKPMYRVDETKTDFLREDIPVVGFSKEEVLHNAPTKDDTFITMKRVVK